MPVLAVYGNTLRSPPSKFCSEVFAGSERKLNIGKG